MSFIRIITLPKNKIFYGLVLLLFLTPIACFSAQKSATTICILSLPNKKLKCVAGYSGFSQFKKEGDGATPIGDFYLREIFYRSDRINKHEIKTTLQAKEIQRNYGWCDDVNVPQYNCLIHLPFKGSYESLFRSDHLYDIIVVVGYNDHPVIKGKGSAIFLHIARQNYQPTVGCIAFSKRDLLTLISYLTPNSRIHIGQGTIKIF